MSDEAAASTLISARRITKRFSMASGSLRALDDVTLDVRRHEFLTLLGPSGCGKTTLLRLLAGFERPDAGTLHLEGRDIGDAPPNKRPVNMVFQSYALFPHMNVARNIAFGLEQIGVDRQAIDARVSAMLRLVRLEEMAERNPSQLSGGQQQRVALARALAPNPKLLLLDEPLSALDRRLRRDMQIELKRMQRETGIAFLLVTHDQDEALSMSDRIAVMDRGHIVQIDEPRALYDRPRTPFVADFMGANVIPGALLGRAGETLAIRPERVLLSRGGTGFPGKVVSATFGGANVSTLVMLDQGVVISIFGDEMIEPDLPVFCRFPADALVVLET